MSKHQLEAAQRAHDIAEAQLKEIPEHDTLRRKILLDHQAQAKSLVNSFSTKVPHVT